MSGRFSPFLPCCLLVGCAGAPARPVDGPADRQAADRDSVVVSLQVDQVLAEGTRRPLVPGEVLHSGDRIGLSVSVDRKAYVYLVQAYPNGSAKLLYPEGPGPEHVVGPDAPVSVPPGGELLQLDRETGQEDLYAVASTRPIGEAAPRLLGRLGVALAQAEDDKKKGPTPDKDLPPPQEKKPPDRGLTMPGDTKNVVRRRTDAGGVAVLRFSFTHR